jgi:hypothetical protein
VPRVPLNIRIPSELLDALKKRAALEGSNVTELLVRGAQALLGSPPAPPKPSSLERRVERLETRVQALERKDEARDA